VPERDSTNQGASFIEVIRAISNGFRVTFVVMLVLYRSQVRLSISGHLFGTT
jgi:hypothetical protein